MQDVQARASSRRNLPSQPTSFIGRARELADLEGILFTTHLLTLTGAGGVGKTRLALELASRLAGRFPDGVWLAQLAPLADAALVPQTIAVALGIPERSEGSATEGLIRAVATRHLLIVLDNCEHLIDASAAVVDALLHACPQVHVLATSREALNLSGELVVAVPPLSLPDTDGIASAEASSRFEAVRLFAERARAVWPGFVLDDSNLPAVVRICRHLDGIPLAIELASARVRMLSPEEIAARMDRRFQLLTAGSRTAEPRHQTLQALVDWSYELLAENERLLLRRLSVFAGGWTLAAAEAVCSGARIEPTSVLALLAALVDKSLVVVTERGAETRYGLLETLRQYAAEKLEQSGEAPVVRGRQLAWFRELAERLEAGVHNPEQGTGYALLEIELGNIRAALDWSRRQPSLLEDGLRLAAALWRFWYLCGHAAEGEAWLATFLEMVPADGPALPPSLKRAQAAALTSSAWLAAYQDRASKSRPLSEAALALWRELDDKAGMAFALRELGRSLLLEQDLEQASVLLDESLALARELNSRPLICLALSELGRVARRRGQYERAQALSEECVALSREQGDLRRVALSLLHWGWAALEGGSLDLAGIRLRESLLISEELGALAGFAPPLELLARLAATEGRPDRALCLAGAAAAVQDAFGAVDTWYAEAHAGTESWLQAARQSLGEQAAEAAWNRGRLMPLDQVPAYVQADDERATRSATQADPLTAREREVAALVARGLMNREIAAALFISEGTAKRHVENILDKLGLRSRQQVTSWATDRGILSPEAGAGVIPFKLRHADEPFGTGPDPRVSGGH